MLKTRVIPVILYDTQFMVRKPKRYEYPGRNVGSLMQHVLTMNSRDIDELILIDIDATRKKRLPLWTQLKEYTSQLFCPVTIGGGIRQLEDIEAALHSGADKVAINSAATDLSFIDQAIKKFGSQAIVISLDSKIKRRSNGWEEAIHDVPHLACGTLPLDISTIDFVRSLEDIGVGEILLTSIDNDGGRAGYDQRLIKSVCNNTKLPVIANGGCVGFSDMAQALKNGAHAVAASSIFLFTGVTPKNCSFYLENHGFAARV